MARKLRIYSNSKIYHIIFKGIDNQDIFYDDQDRRVFLKLIAKTKMQFAYKVSAYCLMDNHVHMIIKIEKEFLSKAMQCLMARYVHYFNKKYKRIGTLVQGRFKSKSVENQKYFLDVCRYVHRNPENAGIEKTENYEWSSYKEYLGKAYIVDKKLLLNYLENDINVFVNYTAKKNEYEKIEEFAEYEMVEKLKDSEVINFIIEIFKINDMSEISNFFKKRSDEELEEDVRKIKRIKGTNKTQVARITRISRWRMEKLWNKE